MPTAESDSPNIDENAAKIHVGDWLLLERGNYAEQKFSPEQELVFMAEGFGQDSAFMNAVLNYFKRAELFGADTEAGRQAMGKLIVTARRALESAVLVHGRLPKPGLPSGECEPWIR